MRLYSLRRDFLQRVHGRWLSPLSTRVRSLRPESLFERRENETSPWNPSLGRYSRLCFDPGPSDRKDSTSLQGHSLLRCGFSVRPMTGPGQIGPKAGLCCRSALALKADLKASSLHVAQMPTAASWTAKKLTPIRASRWHLRASAAPKA